MGFLSQGEQAEGILGALLQRLSFAAQRRSLGLYLALILLTLMVAMLELTVDPISAWEHSLRTVFGLVVPVSATFSVLASSRVLASPMYASALAARHGANRRQHYAASLLAATAFVMAHTVVALVLCRAISHSATEATFNLDLVHCCGIGCLTAAAYIGFIGAAARVGSGRIAAWAAFGLDLILGHVEAAWAAIVPRWHVLNLIGHPSVTFLSARASSWILLGFVLLGIAIAIAKTPK
ncbi:MAG TPA: hypothetical protein VKP30_14600 [Polyangiaceae bacterium]|nr:hypothetical protein [Polyangiaceae bacterium]